MIKKDLNTILTSLHQELAHILGAELEGIYLYGSQARGDASPGSDIDVLIVLQGDFDYFEMMDLTSESSWRISLENDVVISRVFVSKEKFTRADSPFLRNIANEAIAV